MASTYVNDLRLEEIATGEKSGSWGTVTNSNLELIAEAFSYGAEAIANASTHTITVADGSTDEARSFYLKCTGGGQACTVTLAPNTLSKVWMIENATSYTLTFTQGSGANVAVAAGQVKIIATDGGGSGAIIYDLLTDVNLAGTTVYSALNDGTTTLTSTVAELNRLDITTLGTSQASKAVTVDSSGDLLVPDSDKFKFGNGGDLEIYHDGTHSYVSDVGTGNLNLVGASVHILGTGETMATFVDDGAVTLFHNNAAKIATASGGVAVTGQLDLSSHLDMPDDSKIKLGTGDDLEIYHDGTHSYVSDVGTGNLNLVGASVHILGTGETMATFVDDGAVTLYFDNAIKLATVTGGVNVTGTLTATTNVTVSSDIRLKSNIETIDSALDKVKEMRGVYFDRHDDKATRAVGVIAQEMQEIMPEVVATDDTEDKYLSVAYGNLVGVLIEAVKELSDKVEKLEAK